MKNLLSKLCLVLSLVFAGSAFGANYINDTFTATNGTLLSSHVGELGATWSWTSSGTNSATINSNRLYWNNTSSFGTWTASGTSPSASKDIMAIVHVMSVSGDLQILGNLSSGNSYYIEISSGTLAIGKYPGGANIVSTAMTWTPGSDYTVRMSLTPGKQKLYLNGVLALTSTDSALTLNTGDGVQFLLSGSASTTTGFHVDQLSAGPVLDPGVSSASATSSTTVTASGTAATGDSSTYTYQYQRAPDSSGSPGAFANVGSAQSGIALGTAPTSLSDTGLTASTTYWYRGVVTYALDSSQTTTAPVSVSTSAGGPNLFLKDTFTGTDGTLLTAHTGETGATWTWTTSGSNVAQLVNNRVFATSFGTWTASGTSPAASKDIVANVHIMSNTSEIQVLGNLNSGNSYYIDIVAGTIGIGKYPGGTNIASTSFTWTVGGDYNLRLSLTSGKQRLYVNGVLIVTSSDSSLTLAAGNGVQLLLNGATTTTGYHIDSITGGPVLDPGVSSATATSSTTVTASGTAATGDSLTYTYQYQRAPDASGSPGTFANVGSAQSGIALGTAPTSLSDTGLTAATTYWYRGVVTYALDSSQTTTAPISVTTSGSARAANTYYVAAAGSDSNNGTSTSTPWQTIAKVNSFGLVPGDTVLFNDGDTFSGNLTVNPSSAPTATTRITIGNYGSGALPIINPSNLWGVKLLNCGFVTVHNLNIVGPGVTLSSTFPNLTTSTTSDLNLGAGVYLEYTTTTTWYGYIVLDNLTISGTYDGIVDRSTNVPLTSPSTSWTNNNATAGYEYLTISNCTIHDGSFTGIDLGRSGMSLTTPRNHRYCRIVGNTVYNIWGDSTVAYGTGFGIFMFHALSCTVERCVVYNIGQAQSHSATNGTVSFMWVFSNSCVTRFCEGHDSYSPQNVDGGIFDFDQDCHNCTYEYCYGHDTDGCVCGSWDDESGDVTSSSGNTYAFCILVNGSRRANGSAASIISTIGDCGDLLLRNCVFFQTENAGASTPHMVNVINNGRGVGSMTFIDNIISAGNGADFGIIQNGSRCVGNLYEVRTGSSFSFNVNGTACGSLSALRTAGYEIWNGINFGATGSPNWLVSGSTAAVMPGAVLQTFKDYEIQSGSSAIGIAVDPAPFQLGNVPSVGRDFHGNAATGHENSAVGSAFDAGPYRFGSITPTGATPRAFVF